MFLPLELNLRPSRVHAAVLALVHGLALSGVWLAVLPVWMQSGMAAALLASAAWSWREISRSPRGLRVNQSGQIELLDGEWRAARIRGRPLVLPWLVSAALAVEGGGVRKLALLPDSTEPEELRRLRVWLKWSGPAG